MATEQNLNKSASKATNTKKSVSPKPKAVRAKTTADSKGSKKTMSSPDKLQLLFTIVNREKTEFYVDLLHNFEINLQMVLNGYGTASSSVRDLLGLTELEKSVIISVVRKDKAKEALAALEEKCITVKNGKGVAYTVPMSSVIGVNLHQFLSNNRQGRGE